MKLLLIALLTFASGAAQDVGPGTPESPWSRAQALAPGEARARVLVEALAEVQDEALEECLILGYEEFVNQTRAFRMDLALPLAERMHARALADWSAMSLALASTRAGDSTTARSTLVEQLARTPEGPAHFALMERLGLASLGAGEVGLARRELGGAFTRGSANAGVVLGGLALHAGRLDTARALFRSLLDEEPAQSWAHRGWGLSMLPRAPGAVVPD